VLDPAMKTTGPDLPSMVQSIRVPAGGSGEFEGFEPIPAEELADGQQPVRLGAGRELVAPAGVPQRRLELAGAEAEQAGPAVPLVRFQRAAEQPQVALTPPTDIGYALPGAAGRTAQDLAWPGGFLGVMAGHGWVRSQSW
jgi:hypothetical protein